MAFSDHVMVSLATQNKRDWCKLETFPNSLRWSAPDTWKVNSYNVWLDKMIHVEDTQSRA